MFFSSLASDQLSYTNVPHDCEEATQIEKPLIFILLTNIACAILDFPVNYGHLL